MTEDGISSSNGGRNREPPVWKRDYVTGEGLSDEENDAYLVMSAAIDPIHIEDAVKSEKWRRAIDVEMEAIEKKHTWELTDLPKGAKKVGVRWVYKTKFNENGEVETIRLLVAFAAQRGWIICQLDVKSAFLDGELTENIFVEQPCSCVQNGSEHKVYKLKRALYGAQASTTCLVQSD